jgi:hypothetical protein
MRRRAMLLDTNAMISGLDGWEGISTSLFSLSIRYGIPRFSGDSGLLAVEPLVHVT